MKSHLEMEDLDGFRGTPMAQETAYETCHFLIQIFWSFRQGHDKLQRDMGNLHAQDGMWRDSGDQMRHG